MTSGGGRNVLNFSDVTIGHVVELVRGAASYGPGLQAIVDGDLRLTHQDFDTWTARTANQLSQIGIGPGDTVLIITPNSAEMLAAVTACWRLGAVPALVVSFYRGHELAQIVAATQPTAVVTTVKEVGRRRLYAEMDDVLSGVELEPQKILLDGSADGWDTMPGPFGDTVDFDLPMPPTDPDEICLLLFTSGSTAAPKGVPLSSRNLLSSLRIYEQRELFDVGGVGLAMAPLSHVGSLVTSFLVPFAFGGSTVLMWTWNVDEAVDLIDREKVTYVGASMTFFVDLLDRYASLADGVYRLPTFTTGGSSAPPALLKKAEALGIWGGRIYGMTETSGVVSAPHRRTSSLHERSSLDGELIDDLDVRIVDDLGDQVSAGETGRILLRGPQVARGYHDTASTRAAFDDGWFDTGDVGYVTEDRWISITGRIKDIINRGGEKLPARDIEESLMAHPAVTAAAVIPIPNDRLGEVPCAFVVIRPGTESEVDLAHMSTFLRNQHLASAKLPAEIHVVESLPVSATGKIQKNRLVSLRASATTP